MNKKLLYIIIIILLSLISFWYYYLRNAREIRLLNEGKEVVKKIEVYKEKYHKLPDSLETIGIHEDENTALYLNYNKYDSVNYSVWIGLSSEESRFYYSDSQRWEKAFRRMGSVRW